MDNNNSWLDDVNSLLGMLLLGSLLLWLLKLCIYAYAAFVTIFWMVVGWLAKECGILLLRTYNLTRRLFS